MGKAQRAHHLAIAAQSMKTALEAWGLIAVSFTVVRRK
jgi:hypothetical protein